MDDQTETNESTASASTNTVMQRRYERHDILRIALEAHRTGPATADDVVATARKFAAFVDEAAE